jgi:protein-tyrosine phosphatase
MRSAIVHVDVHEQTEGKVEVTWVLEGTPGAVDVAVGPTPEQVDHAHQQTVPAGVTTAVVPSSPVGRTFVSVALHDGGPAVVAAERRVAFEGITNFRDLGGYRTADGGWTRWGQVFRADALHFLTADDLARYEMLGMEAVFDLRGETERVEGPNPFPSTWLELLSRPIAETALPSTDGPASALTVDDGERVLSNIYKGMVEHAAPTIGSLLSSLADERGTPAVFHCHAGKDRTGVVAAVLLLALGVDRESILDDYELTGRYRLRSQQDPSYDRLIASGLAPEAAAAVLTTPRWAMQDALEVIDADYGGIDAWLVEAAGMTTEVVSALRDRLTVHPA